ncbi:MAG: hypothetical protein ABIR96_09940, partial [Bdellovibrionota bacterium]
APINCLPPKIPLQERSFFAEALPNTGKAGMLLPIAISRHGSRTPTFYVGAHVPDGTKIEVQIVGVPATLIGKPRFFARQEAEVEAGMATTAPVTGPAQQPLPIGEYRVWARALGTETKAMTKISEILAAFSLYEKNGSRSYFLGSARDESYRRQLKDYLVDATSESSLELQELEQYATTLQSQLTKLQRPLALAARNPASLNRARDLWQNTAPSWLSLAHELDSTVDAWTDSSVYSDFFHSNLYLQVQSISANLQKLTDRFQVSLRDGPGATHDFESDVSSLQEELATLKNGITEAKRDPSAAIRLPPQAPNSR